MSGNISSFRMDGKFLPFFVFRFEGSSLDRLPATLAKGVIIQECVTWTMNITRARLMFTVNRLPILQVSCPVYGGTCFIAITQDPTYFCRMIRFFF